VATSVATTRKFRGKPIYGGLGPGPVAWQPPSTRRTLIVALARKLLIAIWRFARDRVVPKGVRLRPAA
jgi:hypothetical protein